MSRIWTARKATTFEAAAVAGSAEPAFPLDRAGPEPAAAAREALRLLVAYAFLLLPLHCGVCWLSTRSMGLAAGLVLVAAGAALALAIAKWLALDDLVQKLPVLFVLALIGLGLAYLPSEASAYGLGRSPEFFGLLFLAIVAASILGSLYRPLAATYRVVTLKTPFRDLCVAAGAMLASLALVAAAHALPRFALGLLACAACGGYAGLVVTEYAAWARANPAVPLARVIAFGKGAARPGKGGRGRPGGIDPQGAVQGAAVFGLSYGLVCTVLENAGSPSPEFRRFVTALGEKPGEAADLLGGMLISGVSGLIFGFVQTGHALGATRPGSLLVAAKVTPRALVLFLTYPEPQHPLVHRLRQAWLRPQTVRAALTGVVFMTVATLLYAPSEKPKTPPTAPTAPANSLLFLPSVGPSAPAGDQDLARAFGRQPEPWPGTTLAPPPAIPPTPPPAPQAAAGPGAGEPPGFVSLVIGLLIGPPLLVAVMVLFVGAHVLPAYSRYFESPDASG